MFSDLVGSTALEIRTAWTLKTIREVISAPPDVRCGRLYRSFGGYVPNYAMGDGVLTYFGFTRRLTGTTPRKHAVRAGLELVAAVSDLKGHDHLVNACWHRNGTGITIAGIAKTRHRRRDCGEH